MFRYSRRIPTYLQRSLYLIDIDIQDGENQYESSIRAFGNTGIIPDYLLTLRGKLPAVALGFWAYADRRSGYGYLYWEQVFRYIARNLDCKISIEYLEREMESENMHAGVTSEQKQILLEEGLTEFDPIDESDPASDNDGSVERDDLSIDERSHELTDDEFPGSPRSPE